MVSTADCSDDLEQKQCAWKAVRNEKTEMFTVSLKERLTDLHISSSIVHNIIKRSNESKGPSVLKWQRREGAWAWHLWSSIPHTALHQQSSFIHSWYNHTGKKLLWEISVNQYSTRLHSQKIRSMFLCKKKPSANFVQINFNLFGPRGIWDGDVTLDLFLGTICTVYRGMSEREEGAGTGLALLQSWPVFCREYVENF